jgi:hypothetical protein
MKKKAKREKRKVDELLEEQRERERVAGLSGEELREYQAQQLQERRRAQHDELKAEYLQVFEAQGGTKEEFGELWPNLSQSVIGQRAIEAVEKGKAQARRQARAIWGGSGSQGTAKGAR